MMTMSETMTTASPMPAARAKPAVDRPSMTSRTTAIDGKPRVRRYVHTASAETAAAADAVETPYRARIPYCVPTATAPPPGMMLLTRNPA